RGVECANALQYVNADRSAYSLELERAEITQPEEPRNQLRAVLGQVDLIGRGELFHPLAKANGVAVGCVDHFQVIADRPHHDLTRVVGYVPGKTELTCPVELLGIALKLFLQMQRRVARAPCMVFVGDRCTEDRHDSVAGELVDCPLETVDPVGEN